jgi:hypothetical protein
VCVCVGVWDVFIKFQLGTRNRKTSQLRRCLSSWDVQRKVSPHMKETTALPSMAPTSLGESGTVYEFILPLPLQLLFFFPEGYLHI